jgi:transcriptional regulator with XRE-family HTH domain
MARKNRRIYSRLREKREQMGLTLREAAQRVGMSHSYLHEIEMGIKEPKAGILKRIAKTYQLSTAQVLARTGKLHATDIYPRIHENPDEAGVRERLRRALKDPLFEDLFQREYKACVQRMPKKEAMRVAVRSAEITLNNSYALNFQSAIRDESLRWSKQAGRKRRSTPEEAKNLVAELYWKYQRCQKMYRSLYVAHKKRYPPADLV